MMQTNTQARADPLFVGLGLRLAFASLFLFFSILFENGLCVWVRVAHARARVPRTCAPRCGLGLFTAPQRAHEKKNCARLFLCAVGLGLLFSILAVAPLFHHSGREPEKSDTR
nr:hypothetical protein [Pandoravirus massiliensis]